MVYLYSEIVCIHAKWGFPRGSKGKESACNVEDLSSIPGPGRFPGEENGNPLQYSCLGNPIDRADWWRQSMALQESNMNDLATKPPQPPLPSL